MSLAQRNWQKSVTCTVPLSYVFSPADDIVFVYLDDGELCVGHVFKRRNKR